MKHVHNLAAWSQQYPLTFLFICLQSVFLRQSYQLDYMSLMRTNSQDLRVCTYHTSDSEGSDKLAQVRSQARVSDARTNPALKYMVAQPE